MSTFESIREFVVPAELCDVTDQHLREAGLDGYERFILWSGVVRDDRLLVRTSHSPRQIASSLAGGLCVRVDADELHRLNVWLYENAERLAIQVHSHPREAFHSDTDDAYPMVTTLGGLSLVVPDFARYGVRGPRTALYRLSNEGWQRIAPIDARRVLRLED
ncbi:Mov34/MPN/PAD-1 family protein [Candidatus Palauibacter sp.]|uniref:Mov34/MPN/PAD-1 family protein n=1 Tax=Candidatus Palauibacter sp. TaxID=3101350 RepID=UPI003D125644